MAEGNNEDLDDADSWVVIPKHLKATMEGSLGSSKHKNNKIKTTKYTLLNFFPKNLAEQFRRFANWYFASIIILNFIPQVSAFGKEISMIPLIFVLSVTAIKDLFEDRRRYLSDKTVNNRECKVLSCNGPEVITKTWKALEVGDTVHLESNDVIPADMVLLRTRHASGIAYVSTASLDGETNLKQKQVVFDPVKEGNGILKAENISKIACEKPNNKIHQFSGYLITEEGHKLPLDRNNLLLRGCVIKNTEFIEGIIVYAGHDTKAMLNNSGPRSKRSKLETFINKDVIGCVVILLAFCTIGGIGCGLWTSKYKFFDENFSPGGRTDSPALEGFIRFWSFIIVLQVIIPISLYVSVELVKIGQVYFMNQDVEMYTDEGMKYPVCRATNINEDLGQIEYVFSDKTGTLTENQMIFKRFSVKGLRFHIPDENGRETRVLKPRCLESLDVALESYGETVRDNWKDFFLALAVCNTVVIGGETQDGEDEKTSNGLAYFRNPSFEQDEAPLGQSETKDFMYGVHGTYKRKESKKLDLKQDVSMRFQYDNVALDDSLESISHRHINYDMPKYEAESPDEEALVQAAFLYGYELVSRSLNTLTLHLVERGDLRIRLLNVLEFSSARKRMSVIVQYPDGSIVLYCKGADTAILNRLTAHQDIVVQKTDGDLEHFARDGLRTLCVAKRNLTQEQYDEWAKNHKKAETALLDREQKLADSADKIENELILLGATGIEDKLQEGVPETIASLRAANINVWVLTGDKQETAINVAFACKLLDNKMDIIVLNCHTKEECAEQIDLHLQRTKTRNANTVIISTPNNMHESESRPLALVIDGATLAFATAKPLDVKFVELSKSCKAVVCCRATPIQKSTVVGLVRSNLKAMSLAIGDGANDVSMLQTADVGVGIVGQEGMQAVMASDFVLGRFRFLKRLLLLHGAWCYDRTARMIVYFFYKNAMFVGLLFWYQLFNGFSSSNAVDDISLIFFNLIFTSAPPVVAGVWDQSAPAHELLTNCRMYKRGQTNEVYTRTIFYITMLDSLYQSAILFFMPYLAYCGSSITMVETGILFHQTAVWTASLHLAIETPNWTVIHHFFLWGSVVLSYIWYMILSVLSSSSTMYWSLYQTARSADFWMLSFLTPVLALLPRFVYRAIQWSLFPTDTQRARLCARFRKTWSQQSLKNFGTNSLDPQRTDRHDSSESVLS